MSYKLLTDASRGFLDTFNYMIRDNKRYIEEKEIERLNQELETTNRQLEESLKVIEFYADEKNWQFPEEQGFHVDDLSLGVKDMIEEIDSRDDDCGGKKAREFLNKLKNERGE